MAAYCNNRGLAFYRQNKLEEAKKDYDEAIKLNGKEAMYYFNRGNVYSADPTMLEEAHKDYDRAIELDDTNARFYHSKGLAYESTNKDADFELAIENYRMAID